MPELLIGLNIFFCSFGTFGRQGMKCIFQNIPFSNYKIVRQEATYATDMQIKGKQIMYLVIDPVNGRWTCPPPSYVKLNIDGSYRDNCGTYAGILRYENGNWIWEFYGRCCRSNPLHAELLGMCEGLRAVRDRRVLRVLVETDSSQVVNLVHGFPDECHRFWRIF
ncbi:hypothetical protein LguiA_003635 [Lonicera macranthoides]